MLTLAKAVGALLMPLSLAILGAVLGLALRARTRHLGNVLAWLSIGALLVLSLPITGYLLHRTLESSVAPLALQDPSWRANAEAIVVLGGGRVNDAPEYGADTITDA